MDLYFSDLEHLSYFRPDNLDDRLEQLLKDGGLRAKLRRQGREVVLENHTLKDRARVIVEIIESVMSSSQKVCRTRGGEALRLEGEALLMAGLRWPAKAGERRVIRGAMRLRAAAADGAKPLPASHSAGLAELSLGRLDEALVHLRRAGELGGARERLTWSLTAWQAGRHDEFVQQRQKLGMDGAPGDVGFHIEAARLLAREGQAAGIGFNRSRLNAAFWTGLEHLLESTRRGPNQVEIWELLGDLLLSQGAPNQAAQAYERAWHLAASSELEQKRAAAAHKGYMT
jgi:tetratricopeptide (TPR) repeat protein